MASPAPCSAQAAITREFRSDAEKRTLAHRLGVVPEQEEIQTRPLISTRAYSDWRPARGRVRHWLCGGCCANLCDIPWRLFHLSLGPWPWAARPWWAPLWNLHPEFANRTPIETLYPYPCDWPEAEDQLAVWLRAEAQGVQVMPLVSTRLPPFRRPSPGVQTRPLLSTRWPWRATNPTPEGIQIGALASTRRTWPRRYVSIQPPPVATTRQPPPREAPPLQTEPLASTRFTPRQPSVIKITLIPLAPTPPMLFLPFPPFCCGPVGLSTILPGVNPQPACCP
jgi:hypothetical protein